MSELNYARSRKSYAKPIMERVELRLKEAVLATGCKQSTSGPAVGSSGITCAVSATCNSTTSIGS